VDKPTCPRKGPAGATRIMPTPMRALSKPRMRRSLSAANSRITLTPRPEFQKITGAPVVPSAASDQIEQGVRSVEAAAVDLAADVISGASVQQDSDHFVWSQPHHQ
jgi:hypothetical protein